MSADDHSQIGSKLGYFHTNRVLFVLTATIFVTMIQGALANVQNYICDTMAG
jgi:hypothetical protein